MTIIETSVHLSPNNINLLYGFLTDMSNYKQLMPSDKIENWSADQEQCSFRIKGISEIGLKIKDRDKPDKITLESNGNVPFGFEFQILLKELSENKTDVQLVFHGKINAFMKAMVERPLRNFFEMLVQKTSEISL